MLFQRFSFQAPPQGVKPRRQRSVAGGMGAAAIELGKEAIQQLIDRRVEERKATFRAGVVTVKDKEDVPCVVRDLSKSGARIMFEGGSVNERYITLRMDHAGFRKDAEIVWQKGREAGLKFRKS
ncbi:MAG: PilZ domain-containing protein [Parvularculaceae bacterium]